MDKKKAINKFKKRLKKRRYVDEESLGYDWFIIMDYVLKRVRKSSYYRRYGIVFKSPQPPFCITCYHWKKVGKSRGICTLRMMQNRVYKENSCRWGVLQTVDTSGFSTCEEYFPAMSDHN